MKQRINVLKKGQSALKAMYSLGSYLSKSSINRTLLDLIYFRVSQINGCAYCLDMHSKDLRAAGETEQRLHLLNACVKHLFTQNMNVQHSPGRKP